MECPRKLTLVVLTLLQLCRAGHIHPRWHSARLNDGFQQKPMQDAFPSDPLFSTAQPIIVSQPRETNDILYSSTPVPFSSSASPFSSTSQFSSTSTPYPSIPSAFRSTPSLQSTPSPYPSIPTFPSTQSQYPENSQSTRNRLYQATSDIQSSTTQSPLHKPQRNVEVQRGFPENYPVQYNLINPFVPTFQPLLVSDLPNQRQNHFNQHIEPLGPYTSSLPVQNLFQPSTSTVETLRTSDPALQFSTTTLAPPSSTIFLTEPAISTFSQTPVSEVTRSETSSTSLTTGPILTSGGQVSTTRSFSSSSVTTQQTPTASTFPTTLLTSSVTVRPSSTLGSTVLPCNTQVSSLRPPITIPGLSLPFKVRVIAPSGSITNVNFLNGQSAASTARPIISRYTTTKKPTTKRTSKPKKNSYDRCLDGCKKVRDPICAAPLGHYTLDSKTLKGFPSVCHMACHNSFRKEPYEKVANESCDKLRRKIRPLDAKQTFLRNELLNSEFILGGEPKTVIEVSRRNDNTN